MKGVDMRDLKTTMISEISGWCPQDFIALEHLGIMLMLQFIP